MKPQTLPWSSSLLLLACAALVAPTLWRLSQWVWPADEQGHGPLVLLVSVFLISRRWPQIRQLRIEPSLLDRRVAWTLFAFALLMYALGRSQAILLAEVGALVILTVSLVLLHWGHRAVRLLAFPLAFLVFMVPLPEALVAAVTAPMKSAVSTVAALLLQQAGQPVARSGVMLTAGPYQLLVADACAGLTTLFTLEALGLLYLHLRGHAQWWRNAFMAVMVVPIAFAANVLRVITLVMVTLWWGDAAGQGFAHDLAGLTLFVAALLLLVAMDSLLGVALIAWRAAKLRFSGAA
jgi:exosortase B